MVIDIMSEFQDMRERAGEEEKEKERKTESMCVCVFPFGWSVFISIEPSPLSNNSKQTKKNR